MLIYLYLSLCSYYYFLQVATNTVRLRRTELLLFLTCHCPDTGVCGITRVGLLRERQSMHQCLRVENTIPRRRYWGPDPTMGKSRNSNWMAL